MKKFLILLILLVLFTAGFYSKIKSYSSYTPVFAQTGPTPTPTISLTDWPQLQHDAQRTGHSAENISGPVNELWAVGFATTFAPARERLYPQVQPVISGNQVYIGTEMGTFYALNTTTGNKVWQYPSIGLPRVGPILGTAGVENGKVYFGSMDGNVYALNTANGTLAWKFSSGKSGFSSSVLLAEGKVFIPERSGTYYALNEADGSVTWQKDIGTPIFMSSAYNNGQIYFGGMDMWLYAIRSTDGSLIWKSSPINGTALKDYWPVVNKGYVFILPLKVQDNAVVGVENDMTTWSMFTFSEASGQIVFMPQFNGMTMNGATCPPSVDKDGRMIIPWYPGSFGSTWIRLDAVNKTTYGSMAPISGNPDENLCTSTAGSYAIIMHTQEANAQWTGLWNLDNGSKIDIGAYSADDACGGNCFFSNTQGGGTSPAAVSGGIIFHTTQNTLNARKVTLQ